MLDPEVRRQQDESHNSSAAVESYTTKIKNTNYIASAVGDWYDNAYLTAHPDGIKIKQALNPYPQNLLKPSELFLELYRNLLMQIGGQIENKAVMRLDNIFEMELQPNNSEFDILKLTFRPENQLQDECYSVYTSPYGHIMVSHSVSGKECEPPKLLGVLEGATNYLTLPELKELSTDVYIRKVYCAYARESGASQKLLDENLRPYNLDEVPGDSFEDKIQRAKHFLKNEKSFFEAESFKRNDLSNLIRGQTIKSWSGKDPGIFSVYQLDGFSKANEANSYLVIEQFAASIVKLPAVVSFGDAQKTPTNMFRIFSHKGVDSLSPLYQPELFEADEKIKLNASWLRLS